MSAFEAKDTLKNMYELCDAIDELPFGLAKSNERGLTLRKALYLETMKFCMYLSAADGSVSYREAQYLGDLFDATLSPSDVTEIIEENNIYSTSFEQNVPITLQYLVKADNAVIAYGKSNGKLSSSVFVEFFEAVGKDFCMCDGFGGNEREDLSIYLGMLKDYIRENLDDDRIFVKNSPSHDNSLKSKYQILKKK